MWERLKRYWAVLRWLTVDLWRFERRRFVVIVGASFLSRTLLNSTIALLILFLHALESGDAYWSKYLPQGTAVRDLFWPVALTGSAFFIISSLIDFAVVRKMIDISTRHSVSLSRRCLAMISPVLPDLKGFKTLPFPMDTVWLSTSGTDVLMRATRTMLRSIPPLFQFFYAALMLLVIEPLAAVTMALIALPGVGYAYFINSRILENEHQLVKTGRKRKEIAKGLAGNTETFVQTWEENANFFQETAWLRAERVVNKERSRTLSNLIIGIGLLVVMIVLGYEALQGNRRWTTVVTFIALLKIAGGSLGVILGLFAFVSRLYPTLRRFPLYLRDRTFFPSERFNTMKIKNTLGIGDLKRMQIEPNGVYHFYTDVPLSLKNLWFFVHPLAPNKPALAAGLVEKIVLAGSLKDMEALLDRKEREEMVPVIVDASLWGMVEGDEKGKPPGCPVFVCHSYSKTEKANAGPTNGTWIIPLNDGQVGLCTSEWLKDHLEEIDLLLRKRKDAADEEDEDEDEDE